MTNEFKVGDKVVLQGEVVSSAADVCRVRFSNNIGYIFDQDTMLQLTPISSIPTRLEDLRVGDWVVRMIDDTKCEITGFQLDNDQIISMENLIHYGYKPTTPPEETILIDGKEYIKAKALAALEGIK